MNAGDSKVCLYGAGGHAKVVIDILQSLGRSVLQVFDDNPAGTKLEGVVVSEGVRKLGVTGFPRLEVPLILCVGDNARRAEIAGLLNTAYAQAIHHSAIISKAASVGPGTVIFHGAVVQVGSRIGAHVVINVHACVAHDVVVGDFVHVCPHATLCGHVQVGEGTLIGAGAVVIPCVRIGKWCTVGAGAVVVRDLPDFSTAVGNPARVLDVKAPGMAFEKLGSGAALG